MKGSIYLGTYSGIKVFIHWSFLILPIWIAFVNLNSGQDWMSVGWNILFVLVLFLCITLHEFGHALTAKKFSIKTKDITLLPIGGVARLEELPENPHQELLVAIAGPAVNFFISGLLLVLLYATDTLPGSLEGMAINGSTFLFFLMMVNFIIGLFNLIPAFPMDGGRILRALLAFYLPRTKATAIASSLGQLIAIMFAILGLFYNPFLILIAIFVFLGARAEYNIVQSRTMLGDHLVKEVIIHKYDSLETDDTLDFAANSLLDTNSKNFLVFDHGQLAGTLGRDEILEALSSKSGNSLVREIMNRKIKILHPDMSLKDVFNPQKNQGSQFAIMPVMDNNKIIGVIDIENILEFIMIRDSMNKRKNAA